MNTGLKLGNHTVKFDYFNQDIDIPSVKSEGGVKTVSQTCTRCRVFNSADKLITNVMVKKHHNDINCKREGRHFAFKKAMSTKSLTKQERTEIWDDYRKTVNSPARIVEAPVAELTEDTAVSA